MAVCILNGHGRTQLSQYYTSYSVTCKVRVVCAPVCPAVAWLIRVLTSHMSGGFSTHNPVLLWCCTFSERNLPPSGTGSYVGSGAHTIPMYTTTLSLLRWGGYRTMGVNKNPTYRPITNRATTRYKAVKIWVHYSALYRPHSWLLYHTVLQILYTVCIYYHTVLQILYTVCIYYSCIYYSCIYVLRYFTVRLRERGCSAVLGVERKYETQSRRTVYYAWYTRGT